MSEYKVKQALEDLASLEKEGFKINEIRLTGGEVTALPYIAALTKDIKTRWPKATLQLESNGIKLMANEESRQMLEWIDRLHISIDTWHDNVDIEGNSKILDFLLKRRKKYKFGVLVHWATNQDDEELMQKFLTKYEPQQIDFHISEVSPAGRGGNLNERFLAKHHSQRTVCSFANYILLDVDEHWYSCRVMADYSRIGKIACKDFVNKINKAKKIRQELAIDKIGIPLFNRELDKAKVCKQIKQNKGIICDLCKKVNL
jgi:molybdenum cofactor biosynthesis enzyme MoaA